MCVCACVKELYIQVAMFPECETCVRHSLTGIRCKRCTQSREWTCRRRWGLVLDTPDTSCCERVQSAHAATSVAAPPSFSCSPCRGGDSGVGRASSEAVHPLGDAQEGERDARGRWVFGGLSRSRAARF